MTEVESMTREMRDRIRRLETRMTKWLETQGFDTQIQRPKWTHGVVEIPNQFTSIKDILAAIPASYFSLPEAEVIVQHKGKTLFVLVDLVVSGE